MDNQNPITNLSHHRYFLLALGLLNILTISLIFCGLGLLAGFTIGAWQFPLAVVLSLGINFFAFRFFMGDRNISHFLRNSGIILILTVGLIFVVGSVYDVSYDGQWYHQETVYRLNNGYNPVSQNLQVPANEINNTDCPIWCTGPDPIKNYVKPSKPTVNLKFLAINYFSKGSEIIESSIYAITGKIETGKAVNGILIIASFFLCLSLLYKFEKISIPKKWLLSSVIAFNPIAILQMLSFCVDGNVACLILCLLLAGILLYMEPNIFHLVLFSSVIILAVNLKFTSLIFTGIYCLTFLVILWISKKRDLLKQVLLAGLIAGVIGIVCCGFNPYITNITQKGNVFYGTQAVRNETQQIMPQLFQGHNNFETLLLSLSSHQGWHLADKGSLWSIPKIPFTFNKDDITSARDGQQELSGFGPFFSGILLLSLLAFLLLLIKYRKAVSFNYWLALMIVTLFTVLITPYCWWARYVPQLWLVPSLILCMAELLFKGRLKILTSILYASFLINLAWSLLTILFNVSSTAHINYQMKQLQALHQGVKIEYCIHEPVSSNRVRFEEWSIPATEQSLSGPNVYNVEGSSTRFETVVPLPELPKSWLLKMSEHLKSAH